MAQARVEIPFGSSSLIIESGKIPGGFFKREGRSTEREILVSRLIDRSVRPLFPAGCLNEVQIVASVLSHDGENDPDILAIYVQYGSNFFGIWIEQLNIFCGSDISQTTI